MGKMLTDIQIKEILNRQPRVLKHKQLGYTINEYTYDRNEELDVIRRMIWDVKGIDVGIIQQPQNMICNSLMMKLVQIIHPVEAMQKSTDVNLADYMFYRACKYYNEKFKEND